ncbi:ThiF family adenylyltransferase [Mesorhizobium sp. BH1-1-5]|uniref:ThiF family adenylyltransferase n=1 Tax=Mesorhizobium sp. BH1-1-5 TaxID=2876661 RepID=UPI001CCDB4A8|nr:ThiF family adenylyltransferase [Mesorhizobium sp. BH1-1-5]MBZ9991417.1 ThiF family adenylyltransferase [Mesorhizobium sp. BH1-1-5]
MSHRLLARSDDLLALRNAGFHLEIRSGYLLVKDVPYVTSSREVREDGVLFSKLETQVLDGHERTKRPDAHVAYWTGEHPCQADGAKIRAFENPSAPQNFGKGVQADFTFSAKASYRDYVHKMQAYLGWIVGEAQKIRPEVTAQTFPVYATDEDDDDVFNYIDTASSRVHVGADNEKLEEQRVAIIGVGGTGSYVLDFVAKTRVAEIHIFDGDRFDTHNAFRAPGAWSLEELESKKSKVDTLGDIYGKLRRRGLIKHPAKLTTENIQQLEGINFAFLCLDNGKSKRAIVDWLLEHNVSFIDVGMGVVRAPTGLQGIVRVLTCTPGKSDHIATRMSFGEDDEAENEYATNIQIAELNALNAAMAVIRWKRLIGFYRDAGREHYSSYQIATGVIAIEETE